MDLKYIVSEDIQNGTCDFRKFDREYRNIYASNLEQIYDRTTCRKPCSYKKYSLVGEEQPAQFDNGHFLFSLAAMQDSIEVSNYKYKKKDKGEETS